MKRHALWARRKIVVLTDPERRVYNGVPFSSEERWTEWGYMYSFPSLEEAEESAASWREINPGVIEYEVRPT